LNLSFGIDTQMEVVGAPTSAAGILSLIDDPDDEVKILALEELEPLCDRFWAEISDKLPVL
jgi:26S proteasome regulatory subunit N2